MSDDVRFPDPKSDVELAEDAAAAVLAAAVQTQSVFKADLLELAATAYRIVSDMKLDDTVVVDGGDGV